MQWLDVRQDLMPYAARITPHLANSPKEIRLVSNYVADAGCFGPLDVDFTGMLNVEFEEWILHDLPSNTSAAPNEWNTLLGGSTLPRTSALVAARTNNKSASVADDLFVVNEEDVSDVRM
eukprot:gene7562-714_t